MSRRLAREAALQVLFQVDVGHNPVREALAYTLEELLATGAEVETGETAGARTQAPASRRVLTERDRVFLQELVLGTLEKQAALDALISKFTPQWPLERMANIDRNILRLATYELCWREDIPAEVAIDEAVELAKRYGTEDSPRFVNGVLAQILREQQGGIAGPGRENEALPPQVAGEKQIESQGGSREEEGG